MPNPTPDNPEEVMQSTHSDFVERIRQDHEASIERGEHDEQCEVDVDGRFYLCHCSKRRREAVGFTEPPTDDLDFPPPSCPRCGEDVIHDGDTWCCYGCSLSWDSNGYGHTAWFTDDFGDLTRCEKHGRRSCWRCQKEPSRA